MVVGARITGRVVFVRMHRRCGMCREFVYRLMKLMLDVIQKIYMHRSGRRFVKVAFAILQVDGRRKDWRA